MKSFSPLIFSINAILFSLLFWNTPVHAQSIDSQVVTLSAGWNVISTPKVLDSHEFSVAETSENFDIYMLDESDWSTMYENEQDEFQPLYGYFINNKTGIDQTLTFNYKSDLSPNERLFERVFDLPGWYSIGVANSSYATSYGAGFTDNDNPSDVLSILDGSYDLFIDFTDASYSSNRKSPNLVDPWNVVLPSEINSINDLRETKGYAVYITEEEARYIGFQSSATTSDGDIYQLELGLSSVNPDATTFALDEDDNVEEAIFAFELSAEDSEGDIDLNEIVLSATVTTATNIDDLVNDFRIEIDGQSFDAESYTGTAQTLTNLTFDIDGGVTISADESVTVTVYADFEDMEANDEGSTIAIQIESEDIDSDVVVSGLASITSETHTLRTTGVDIELVDDSVTFKANTDATTTDDEGVFVIEFDVTAFGSDLYIDDVVAQDEAMGTAGANYKIFSNGSLVASTTAAGVATLDSDAELTGGKFKVKEGETKTFTLTVEYDPAASGSFKAALYSVNFNDTNAAADIQQLATPAEDFDTASLTI